MSARVGIASVGAYVPRYRLTGPLLAQVWGGPAAGERAVANYDEDALTMACEAVLAALAPVVISRYGLGEHEVWALSSVLFFVGWIGAFLINNLSPEARAEGADPVRRSVKIVRLAVWVPSMAFLFLAPIGIVLGLAPDFEEAIYFTLVALAVAWCSIALLMLVFTGRRPVSAT